MRIAFIVNEFPVVSETFILDQISWLIGHGFQVDVFAQRLHPNGARHPEVVALSLMDRAYSLSRPESSSRTLRRVRDALNIVGSFFRRPGVMWRVLKRARHRADTSRLNEFYRVLPFISRRSYDVVHCHFGPNGILALGLRDVGVIRCPVIVQFHGYDVSSYVQLHGSGVYQELFKRGDQFLCVSEQIKGKLIDWGCEVNKIRIHHTGVHVNEIPFAPQIFGGGGAPRLISVSRLVEKKGVEYALRAVAWLVHEFPELVYVIVGDGPQAEALVTLTRELGLDRNVLFAGAKTREDVSGLMVSAHVLVAPSVRAENGDEEGIPVVLMEALAAGVSVVSTTHAGIPELVSNGVSGMLAPERDWLALAKHIRYLLVHPADCMQMARAGRRVIESQFDVEALNVALLACYREVQSAYRSR